MTRKTEIKVGRLLCGQVRKFLQREAFYNPAFRWIESGGILEHTFCVEGPNNAIDEMNRTFRAWERELDKDE